VIDPENGAISYANAGHPPALLITQAGKMQTCLVATGTPVGAGHTCMHRTCRVKAGSPDLMLMYTDGVIDALSKDALLGIEQIQQIVFDAGKCTAADLIDRVCRQISLASSSSVKDATALLAVCFNNASFGCSNIGGTDERSLEARTA
ncbi:MAG: serine/threonine-protein phosphatase, partial [Acidobacteria bacterium]|nr:serine/threonine-protein phosphatase [Acidobacteriota bacterium]